MDNFCETMFKDDEKADMHVDNDYDFNIKLLIINFFKFYFT